jgi:uncharacterized protein YndB with AHSA1/START domain
VSRPDFVYVGFIVTTPERLWEALTGGEFTKKYWYGRRIESDWREGSPVRFYDGDGKDVSEDGVVLASDRPRRLSYTFHSIEPDPEVGELGYTRVTFTLEPYEGMVKLTLVHDEMPSEKAVEFFREGWAPVLSGLKTYLESGKLLPPIRTVAEARPQPSARSGPAA